MTWHLKTRRRHRSLVDRRRNVAPSVRNRIAATGRPRRARGCVRFAWKVVDPAHTWTTTGRRDGTIGCEPRCRTRMIRSAVLENAKRGAAAIRAARWPAATPTLQATGAQTRRPAARPLDERRGDPTRRWPSSPRPGPATDQPGHRNRSRSFEPQGLWKPWEGLPDDSTGAPRRAQPLRAPGPLSPADCSGRTRRPSEV